MPIRRISIKNYKSLEDFTLDMKPFMVFVGPNNAGKSNILDCFAFLSHFMKDGANAFIERGGFNHIVFSGDRERAIGIELDGSIEYNQEERGYKYLTELEGEKGDYRNTKELLLLLEAKKQRLLEFPSPQYSEMAAIFDEHRQEWSSFSRSPERPHLSRFRDKQRYPTVTCVSEEIANWTFFNLVPLLASHRPHAGEELRLGTHGENLALILHRLRTEHPRTFGEIEELLKTAVPEIEELTTSVSSYKPDHTPYEAYICIREKNLGLEIRTSGMSEGTLRLLALLATVYDPEQPPLVCFEEPENYVHARLLELIVDLLKNASEKTQVLVTTHSPYFVDRVDPEDLFIVEKKEGKTQARPVEDPKGVKEALKTLGLGEMWYSGSLGGVP